jgi:hypothetical protein
MKWTTTIWMVCAITCIGCAPKMTSFAWLEGTWEMAKPNGSSTLEVWTRHNAKAYAGQGLNVIQGDTTLLENLLLHFDHPDTWYVPTVLNQNNGLPVRFKMVSAAENKYVFENAAHDFPQRIVYHYKPIDASQNAAISKNDTLAVDVTSLDGEGIHFRFLRQSLK